MLFVIREPVSFMESLYLQELRGYHYHPAMYERFLKTFGKPPHYFSIEEWLQAVWSFDHHGAFSHLRVADTAQAYADVFGADNVVIMPYEEMKRDNRAFLVRLSQLIGIDAEESLRLCEDQPATRNARWLEAHVERLQEFNRSPLLRWQYRYLKSFQDFKRYLGVMGPDKIVDSPSARATIPAEWKKKILAFTAPQLDAIDSQWNLSLEQYGYVVSETETSTQAATHSKAA
ncbi:MAG: hypothetical protein HUJ26_17005 [Planctomycetaceae bacterium]|nr:hypothetical protein [Planctomycetaceae bacterium]